MAKEINNNESSLIKKVWTVADILSGQGVAYTDYVTQLTYLLFLKMDQESEDVYGEPSRLPEGLRWNDLRREKGMDLVKLYEQILSTLSNFEDEYLAHVKESRCPAGVCVKLVHYTITDKCVGCGLCVRHCPANCISGERKMRHEIDQSRCLKCGACYQVCKFHAVEKH